MSDSREFEVVVNGEARTLSAPTVRAAFVAIGVPPDTRYVAVAINDAVIPRGRWEETRLSANDRVEIITAVAGG